MQRSGLGFKFFTNQGCKSPRKKSLLLGKFCLSKQDYFLVLAFLTPFNGLLPPLPEVQFINFLDFWNPWGKVIERSGLKFVNFFAHKICKIK